MEEFEDSQLRDFTRSRGHCLTRRAWRTSSNW